MYILVKWTVLGDGGGGAPKKGKGTVTKKTRLLGNTSGPHKVKKSHISSDSSDEHEEIEDLQVY